MNNFCNLQTCTPSTQLQNFAVSRMFGEEPIVLEHAALLLYGAQVVSRTVQTPGSIMLLYQDPDKTEKQIKRLI